MSCRAAQRAFMCHELTLIRMNRAELRNPQGLSGNFYLLQASKLQSVEMLVPNFLFESSEI